DSAYTPCYCEENLYFLASRLLKQGKVRAMWDISVVFISNATKTFQSIFIALWSQLRVPAASTAVIWDYYVVIVLRSLSWSQHRLLNTSPSIEEETWIYDLHSISELLALWEDTSVSLSFLPLSLLGVKPIFIRVVSGEQYLCHFSSDRSHVVMMNNILAFIFLHGPPRPYPVICGPLAVANGSTNNLMSHFVSTKSTSEGYGTVMCSLVSIVHT
ncbi:hypothetical protein M405DRAFT_723080, partial [Rhizopogon salebrosus TDB-379]